MSKILAVVWEYVKSLLNVVHVFDFVVVGFCGFFFPIGLFSVLVMSSPEILQCQENSYKHLAALFNNVFCIE